MSELESLRQEIRDIDERLLHLVRDRNRAAKRIGEVKRKAGEPLQNFEVERAVLDHALAVARRLGVHEETTRSLVRALIESALRVQEREVPHGVPAAGQSALVVGGGGLMGGWFCRFLTEQGFSVFVDDPRPNPDYPAGKAGDRAYDLVVVATPPSTVGPVVDEVARQVPDSTLLLDIGSVKGAAAPRLRALAKGGKKVASLHPMFGPRTEVLMGKNVIVLDAGSKTAREAAKRLFANTTSRTVELPLEEHDARMGEVLGLAHATSLVFSEALRRGPYRYADLEPIGSTTFRKQADVAREVAQENPRLYYEIQALNAATDAVLARLERSVQELRRVIAAKDEAGFSRLMLEARRYYGGE